MALSSERKELLSPVQLVGVKNKIDRVQVLAFSGRILVIDDNGDHGFVYDPETFVQVGELKTDWWIENAFELPDKRIVLGSSFSRENTQIITLACDRDNVTQDVVEKQNFRAVALCQDVVIGIEDVPGEFFTWVVLCDLNGQMIVRLKKTKENDEPYFVEPICVESSLKSNQFIIGYKYGSLELYEQKEEKATLVTERNIIPSSVGFPDQVGMQIFFLPSGDIFYHYVEESNQCLAIFDSSLNEPKRVLRNWEEEVEENSDESSDENSNHTVVSSECKLNPQKHNLNFLPKNLTHKFILLEDGKTVLSFIKNSNLIFALDTETFKSSLTPYQVPISDITLTKTGYLIIASGSVLHFEDVNQLRKQTAKDLLQQAKLPHGVAEIIAQYSFFKHAPFVTPLVENIVKNRKRP